MLLDTELITDQENFVWEIVHDFWREHCYHASPLFFNYAVSHRFNPDSLREMVSKNIANPYLKIIPESGIPDCRELEQNYLLHFERTREAWRSDKEEVETILSTAAALNRTRYKKANIPGWVLAMDLFLSGDGHDCTPFEKFEKFTASHILSAVKKGGLLLPIPSSCSATTWTWRASS